MNSNKKFVLMICGVIGVVIFWISWVSSNPADEKAMATFLSVDELISGDSNRRTKLGGLVKNGSIVISETIWIVLLF
jgi:cytochrome c-type biogenesis protein CcmE